MADLPVPSAQTTALLRLLPGPGKNCTRGLVTKGQHWLQRGYSGATAGLQRGYSKTTARLQQGYSRATAGLQQGYRTATAGLYSGALALVMLF